MAETIILRTQGENYPEQEPSQADVDALLNSELCRLSLDERDQVFHDIHGVSDEVVESPELISDCQQKLDDELKKLTNKSAYDLAYAIDPKYVINKEFRLRFLRATLFDPKSAASKIARHFESKMKLFGKEMIVKDITQDDLCEEDLECLYCGFQQFLPVRDRSGRGVVCWLPDLRPDHPVRNRLRRMFYAIMVNTEDEQIQKKGVVGVNYFVGMSRGHSDFDPEMMKENPKLTDSMPVRINALHMCYDSLVAGAIVNLQMLYLNTFTRIRSCTHYGTFANCVDGLKSYGIPVYALPFDENGIANSENHNLFWERRRRLEQANRELVIDKVRKTIVPGPCDVLVGRGRFFQDHIGNVRYRSIVSKYKNRYENSSNFEKTTISFMIVNLVKEYNGRFLKDNGEGWVEIDDKKSREKVAHCFRTMRVAEKTSSQRAVVS